jgi:hypothetical protein
VVHCERVKFVHQILQVRETLVDVRPKQACYLELRGQPRALAEEVDVVMGHPRGKSGLEGGLEAGGIHLEPVSEANRKFERQNGNSVAERQAEREKEESTGVSTMRCGTLEGSSATNRRRPFGFNVGPVVSLRPSLAKASLENYS